MTRVVVHDASCLIDLRKGRLLEVLCRLPCRAVVPLPIRAFELLDFTPHEWALLDRGGMETHDLPPQRMQEVVALRRRHGGLSANDCFCLITAQCFDDGILLTGDGLLRAVTQAMGVTVHGVLWIVDALKAAHACEDALLTGALEIWKADRSVFLPDRLIDQRLHDLRQILSGLPKLP